MAPINRGLSRTQVRREIVYGDVDALATHRAARANRHATPHKILFVGHSFVEGSVVAVTPTDADRPKRFTDRFRDLWRARFPVVAADGSVVTTGGEGWVNDVTLFNPFTYAGGAAGQVSTAPYGLGLYSSMIPVGGTLSYDFTGTAIAIHYAAKSTYGTLTASIDGGAAATQSTVAATADDMKPWTISGLSAGSHTVVIGVTGATCYVDGLFVMNGDESAGTWVYNGGHGGSTSKDWNLIGSGFVSRWTGYAAKYLIPQTVVILGPYNDWRLGASNATVNPAASLAEYQTLIATFNSVPSSSPDPSIVLVNEWKAGTAAAQAGYYNGSDGYDEYTANLYALERQYPNVSVLDLGRLVDPPDTDNTLGLVYGDIVHPTVKGHALIADVLVEYLAA